MGRLRRFIVEYVGNLHFPHRTERRTNSYARELIDWIERQMKVRGFPATKRHALVNDLRHALRANDATGEGMPEWVPEAKGVSRDAPS
jgi:hypothetical protein